MSSVESKIGIVPADKVFESLERNDVVGFLREERRQLEGKYGDASLYRVDGQGGGIGLALHFGERERGYKGRAVTIASVVELYVPPTHVVNPAGFEISFGTIVRRKLDVVDQNGDARWVIVGGIRYPLRDDSLNLRPWEDLLVASQQAQNLRHISMNYLGRRDSVPLPRTYTPLS